MNVSFEDNGFTVPVDGPNAYSADPCVPVDTDTPRLYTNDGVEFVRTPEDNFSNLTDYPWDPQYAIVDGGMRMHYLDEGDAAAEEVVVMIHGQPSWSYLYRKMVPPLLQRGYRVICIDLLGLGKSDKPTSLAEHTYLKHIARVKSLLQQVLPQVLEEPTINLFVQDWGSLIGLRVVGDEPSWFKRVVVANGALPVLPPNGFNPVMVTEPVNFNCSDTRSALDMMLSRLQSQPCGVDASCFSIWINFALTNPYWKPSDLLDLATFVTLSELERSAYNAPYPSRVYTAAIRALPSMVAGLKEPSTGNTAAWESLKLFDRPFLSLAGELDRALGSEESQATLVDNIVGASIHSFEHRRYANASHFIQEDVGAEMAAYVADFIDGTAVTSSPTTMTLTMAPTMTPGTPTTTPGPTISSAAPCRHNGSLLLVTLLFCVIRRCVL